MVPYSGADRDQLTIGGEMNKLAANIGMGRNHAAVHWRYDYADSLPLGEAVAISMLRDMAQLLERAVRGLFVHEVRRHANYRSGQEHLSESQNLHVLNAEGAATRESLRLALRRRLDAVSRR